MKLILSKASQELRVDRNCQFLLLTGKLQRNTHKEKKWLLDLVHVLVPGFESVFFQGCAVVKFFSSHDVNIS